MSATRCAAMASARSADLFQTTPQNITQHVATIYEDGELTEGATCKPYLQVRQEGARAVKRQLRHYSLPMILAVGYRVRSHRGTQFRQWAPAPVEGHFEEAVRDLKRLEKARKSVAGRSKPKPGRRKR